MFQTYFQIKNKYKEANTKVRIPRSTNEQYTDQSKESIEIQKDEVEQLGEIEQEVQEATQTDASQDGTGEPAVPNDIAAEEATADTDIDKLKDNSLKDVLI